MADNFISMMRREIADLEAALAENPTFRKIQALKAAIQEYEGEGGFAPATEPKKRAKASPRKRSEQREKALLFAKNMLKGLSTPTPTRDIFAAMEEAGLSLPGNDPANNLSAMLSNSQDFESLGRSGWVLAEAVGSPQEIVGGGESGDNVGFASIIRQE